MPCPFGEPLSAHEEALMETPKKEVPKSEADTGGAMSGEKMLAIQDGEPSASEKGSEAGSMMSGDDQSMDPHEARERSYDMMQWRIEEIGMAKERRHVKRTYQVRRHTGLTNAKRTLQNSERKLMDDLRRERQNIMKQDAKIAKCNRKIFDLNKEDQHALNEKKHLRYMQRTIVRLNPGMMPFGVL